VSGEHLTRKDFDTLLNQEAHRWEGAPFVFRGNTVKGVDCIGVIIGILRRFQCKLPDGDGADYEDDWFQHDRAQNRYLDAWKKFGRLVEEGEKQPGDVVCFWNVRAKKVVHGALYIGNGDVIHAHTRDRGAKILPLHLDWIKRAHKTWVRLFEVEKVIRG